MDTKPVARIIEALQDVAEALERLGQSLPAHDRSAFDGACGRIRRAKMELRAWMEETRAS